MNISDKDIVLARMTGGEKKVEAISARVTDAEFRFVQKRAEHLSMESLGEYVRYLIASDMEKAVMDLNLLADTLVVKVYSGNNVSVPE